MGKQTYYKIVGFITVGWIGRELSELAVKTENQIMLTGKWVVAKAGGDYPNQKTKFISKITKRSKNRLNGTPVEQNVR